MKETSLSRGRVCLLVLLVALFCVFAGCTPVDDPGEMPQPDSWGYLRTQTTVVRVVPGYPDKMLYWTIFQGTGQDVSRVFVDVYHKTSVSTLDDYIATIDGAGWETRSSDKDGTARYRYYIKGNSTLEISYFAATQEEKGSVPGGWNLHIRVSEADSGLSLHTVDVNGGKLADGQENVTVTDNAYVQFRAEADGKKTFHYWIINGTKYTDRDVLMYINGDTVATAYYEQRTAEGLYLVPLERGGYAVTAFDGGGRALTIPAMHDGGKILEIQEGAMQAFSGKELVIEQGIEKIGDDAFKECASLERLTLPDTLKTIGKRAFLSCGLQSVRLPASLVSVGERAFSGNLALGTLDASVVHPGILGLNSFSNTPALTALFMYIPDAMTQELLVIPFGGVAKNSVVQLTVSGGACSASVAAYFPSVKTLGISADTTLAPYTLGAFAKLTTVTFDADETRYLFRGGAVLSKDGKTLVAVLPASIGSLYTYPASVERVEEGAFYGASELKILTVSFTGATNADYNAETDAVKNLHHIFGTKEYAGSYAAVYRTDDGTETTYYLPALDILSVTGESVLAPGALTAFHTVQSLQLSALDTLLDLFGGQTVPKTLKQVRLTDVHTLNENAFNGCKNLQTILLPDTLTTVGAYAFAGTAVTTVALPDTLLFVDDYAFMDAAVEAVAFPAGVQFGAAVLQGTKSLATLSIPLPDAHFGVLFGTELPKTSGFKKVADADMHTYYYLPETLTTLRVTGEGSVAGYAFAGASMLRYVSLGQGVCAIGESAFSACTSLVALTIEGDLGAIGQNAFVGCAALAVVVLEDSAPFEIDEDTFPANLVEIRVADERYQDYCDAAAWAAVQDKLVQKSAPVNVDIFHDGKDTEGLMPEGLHVGEGRH